MKNVKRKLKRKIIVALLPLFFPLLMVALFFFVMVGGVLSQSSESEGNIDPNNPQAGVAKVVWDRVLKEGGTKQGAASLLGNMQEESGVDPTRIQSDRAYDEKLAMDSSVGGYAFGLYQVDLGRRVNLLHFAKEKGKKWQDLELQLEFLFNHDGSDSSLIKELIKGTDINETTENIRAKWERGGVGTTAKRQEHAKYWYDLLTHPNSGGTGGGSSPGASVPPGFSVPKPYPNIGAYPHVSSYPWGQCTWYVYYRAQQLGISYSPYMGNGGDWMNVAGYTVTNKPTVHSALSFSPGQAGSDTTYGHVAFVEQVRSDGSILISESNVAGLGVLDYRSFSKEEASQFHYVIGK